MQRKKFFSFIGIMWMLVGLFTLHAFCWPLVQNVWAYYRWERVPCKVLDRGGYTYLLKNKGYIGAREDFWDRGVKHASRTDVIDPRSLNRYCYVEPTPDPPPLMMQSVLNLDAHKHPERALRYLDRVLLACAVAGILTFVLRKKKPKP